MNENQNATELKDQEKKTLDGAKDPSEEYTENDGPNWEILSKMKELAAQFKPSESDALIIMAVNGVKKEASEESSDEGNKKSHVLIVGAGSAGNMGSLIKSAKRESSGIKMAVTLASQDDDPLMGLMGLLNAFK